MSLRTRLALLMCGVVAAVLVGAGLFAVRLAGEAEVRAAEPQASLLRGFVTHMGAGLPLEGEALPATLARLRDALHVEFAALDAEGRVVAHTWPPGTDMAALTAARPAGAGDPEGLAAVVVGGASFRVGFVRTAGGEPRRGVPPAVRDRVAWLGFGLPEARIAASAGAVARPLLWVTVGAVLLVGLAALLVLAPTVRQIGRLADAARAVAGGDLERDVPVHGTDEVGVLAASFRGMLAGLRESRDRLGAAERLAALGQLATAAAHEIRNPLASIRMTVQMLREASADPRTREDLDLVMREAQRLELFLDDLLAFARPDPGRREVVDLAAIVADVCDLEQARATHLGVTLERAVPADLPTVAGDRRRLTQVLANLVVNGVQAAGTKGRVVVAAARRDGTLALEVRDSGPGVGPDVVPRLFEPFVTSKPNGTGLGLALSRRIAREHGGDLTWTREGAETVFRVVLPAGPIPAPGPAVARASG